MKLDIPFKDVKLGEEYRTIAPHSKRAIVGIKTQPIEVKDEMSAGQRLPFRNAVIIKVFDSGVESIGGHLFEGDDLIVSVDRPVPSGS